MRQGERIAIQWAIFKAVDCAAFATANFVFRFLCFIEAQNDGRIMRSLQNTIFVLNREDYPKKETLVISRYASLFTILSNLLCEIFISYFYFFYRWTRARKSIQRNTIIIIVLNILFS